MMNPKLQNTKKVL